MEVKNDRPVWKKGLAALQLQQSHFINGSHSEKKCTIKKTPRPLMCRLKTDAIVDPMNDGNFVLMGGGASVCPQKKKKKALWN